MKLFFWREIYEIEQYDIKWGSTYFNFKNSVVSFGCKS